MTNADNAVDNNNSSNHNSQTAADPQPSPTPEQLVEQIRAMRATIANLASLSQPERNRLKRLTRVPHDTLQAQVNIIVGPVEPSLGLNAAEVRQMMDDDNRWSAVEDEVKSLFDGLQGANLKRRHAIVLAASQAAVIGETLARDPKNVALVSQVKEIRRVKRAATRKKPSTQQAPPSDAPAPAAGM